MKKIFLTFILTVLFTHFMYADNGPQIWTASLTTGGQIWALAINPVNQQVIYAGSNTTGIWKTTNNGQNWFQTNTGLTNLAIQAIAVGTNNPSIVYCGSSQTGGGGVYKSTNAGTSWSLINNGIQETSISIQAIVVDPTDANIAYIGVFDGIVDSPVGLYKTTNGGQNWTPSSNGLTTYKNVLSLAINPLNPNVLYAGISFEVASQLLPARIFKSVNGGASWTDMSNGLPFFPGEIKPVRCLSISTLDTQVVIAGLFNNTDSLTGGMYLSTNGGSQWNRRNSGLPSAIGTHPRACIIRPGSAIEFYVGMGNATNTNIGIYKTNNAGFTWSSFNGGTMLNTTTVRALAFKITLDSTLFAGVAHPSVVSQQGVFEYSLVITSTGNNTENLPDKFLLKQNYPNPFNPVTNIEFNIPNSGFVNLEVFDINGKLIKTLINKNLSAGNYVTSFEAHSLPSGMYFYKLTTKNFVETKKMILIK
ncbi:MAG TPA: T9SS type A sorting domain-containing protein [Ignavibacteria bacterium]|nr:T9SS type A sorting domain-containing protein [Ignavibacteria bacterium]